VEDLEVGESYDEILAPIEDLDLDIKI